MCPSPGKGLSCHRWEVGGLPLRPHQGRKTAVHLPVYCPVPHTLVPTYEAAPGLGIRWDAWGRFLATCVYGAMLGCGSDGAHLLVLV